MESGTDVHISTMEYHSDLPGTKNARLIPSHKAGQYFQGLAVIERVAYSYGINE